MPALFNKGFQIVIAGGVEQTKPCEVALGPELLRSGSRRTEESSERGLPRSDRRYWRARVSIQGGELHRQLGAPLGIEYLSVTVGRGRQIIEIDTDDLTVEKGIGIGVGS